jgi:arylsulfatase A-like enzyme
MLRLFLLGLAVVMSGLTTAGRAAAKTAPPPRPPNVVIIFADDLGYADPGCFGARDYRTPHLDRLAREGMRFTSFYAAQAVCSASRAALLTGCFPNRIGILGALGPRSRVGLNPTETTLAEVLRERGYATGIFGKWHLGDAPEFLPTRHGFDEYFGLPYSNDMWPFHPDHVNLPPDAARRKRGFPDLPLIENERVVNPRVTAADQRLLTTWYTERAVSFIQRHRERPFFLYVPHSMPHVPLFVSDKFACKTRRGLYGDVIAELDWSVGEILKALRRHHLDDHTLVIFTSDNGPWLLYGDHAGSARPLREGKATAFEGGVRVPCVMRWPKRIPAGRVCDQVAGTIDLLPTVARLAGATLPAHRLDGRDLGPLLAGEPGATSPHASWPFYWGNALHAIRSGKWKLHFPHSYPQPQPPGRGGQPGQYATREIGLELFDLEADVAESRNVAAEYPEVVARLQELAAAWRDDLGDSLLQREGAHTRPVGRLPDSSAP